MKVAVGMNLILQSPDQEVMHKMYIQFGHLDCETTINNLEVTDWNSF